MFGWGRRSKEDSLQEKIKLLEKQLSELFEEKRAADQRHEKQRKFFFASFVLLLVLQLISAFDIINAISDNWDFLESRFWIAEALISIFTFLLALGGMMK